MISTPSVGFADYCRVGCAAVYLHNHTGIIWLWVGQLVRHIHAVHVVLRPDVPHHSGVTSTPVETSGHHTTRGTAAPRIAVRRPALTACMRGLEWTPKKETDFGIILHRLRPIIYASPPMMLETHSVGHTLEKNAALHYCSPERPPIWPPRHLDSWQSRVARCIRA